MPARVVHPLPDHVSFDAGVLIEPASVVLHGLEKARPQPGETVGVIGIGTLGSLAIALLRLHSPARLVAYGVREAELELATALGASEVVIDRRRRARRGRRARPRGGHRGRPVRDRPRHRDLPPREAARSCSASPATTASLTLPSDLLTGKDMALIGSLGVSGRRSGRASSGWSPTACSSSTAIVTHRFPAAEFQEAVRLMDDRHGIVAKIVLEHDHSS